MSAAQSLKSRNRRSIALVGLFDLGVYFLALGFALPNGQGDDWVAGLRRALSPIGALLLALPLVPTLLTGLVPSTIKAKLAHWRVRHELPGSRAFTQLGPEDPRVDIGALSSRYGALPTEPASQNRLWYRIYTKHEARPAVRDVHGDYLLARDVAALSVLLVFSLGPALGFVVGWTEWATWTAVGVLAVQHALAALAAQNYGERLVTTVLAWESGVDSAS